MCYVYLFQPWSMSWAYPNNQCLANRRNYIFNLGSIFEILIQKCVSRLVLRQMDMIHFQNNDDDFSEFIKPDTFYVASTFFLELWFCFILLLTYSVFCSGIRILLYLWTSLFCSQHSLPNHVDLKSEFFRGFAVAVTYFMLL